MIHCRPKTADSWVGFKGFREKYRELGNGFSANFRLLMLTSVLCEQTFAKKCIDYQPERTACESGLRLRGQQEIFMMINDWVQRMKRKRWELHDEGNLKREKVANFYSKDYKSFYVDMGKMVSSAAEEYKELQDEGVSLPSCTKASSYEKKHALDQYAAEMADKKYKKLINDNHSAKQPRVMPSDDEWARRSRMACRKSATLNLHPDIKESIGLYQKINKHTYWSRFPLKDKVTKQWDKETVGTLRWALKVYLPMFYNEREEEIDRETTTKKQILNDLEEWFSLVRQDVEDGDGSVFGCPDWKDKNEHERWADVVNVEVLRGTSKEESTTAKNVWTTTALMQLTKHEFK